MGLTYLFISHSMPLVRYLCDLRRRDAARRLVEMGEGVQVCEAPCDAYTQQLIAATPGCRPSRTDSHERLTRYNQGDGLRASLSSHAPYLWLVAASLIA